MNSKLRTLAAINAAYEAGRTIWISRQVIREYLVTRSSRATRAYEAALKDNHQLADVKAPVKILRTIHSFDPCIACAVHLTDPDSGEQIRVNIT